MITEEKFVEIISKLIAKSLADQVVWQMPGEGEYRVQLSPDTRIDVIFRSPRSDSDNFEAALSISDRQVVTLFADDGSIHFKLLHRLYHEADRSYWGWDKALEAIDNLLASDKKVGEKPPPPTKRTGFEAFPDDIPF